MARAITTGRRGSGPRSHPLGFCTCASHVDRPWNRSEHWTADEVSYLEARFGLKSDRAIATHLGRSIVGIRLKAKRLGLRKKDAGYTARSVALIFGVDEGLVSKVWIRRYRILASRRPYRAGPNKVHLVMESDLKRFIREHGEWIDVDRMPDSPYRNLAAVGGRWYSLPGVQRLTRRHPHVLAKECSTGRWPARKRGPHWMIHESLIPAIKASAGRFGRFSSVESHEARLARIRNVRKGIEQPGVQPEHLRRAAA